MNQPASHPIYEFDALVADYPLVDNSPGLVDANGVHRVPPEVFAWVKNRCLRATEEEGSRWLRMTQRSGREAVQVTSFVGVIRAPNGYQIEVLPKLGKAIDGGHGGARELLIRMLCCLPSFRHVKTDSARLLARKMPLLEVFVAEFLRSVQHVVKRGLRGGYYSRRENVFALRGKLLVSAHLRQNLHRADRFFTEHDEFTSNRPENRLLHSALKKVLDLSSANESQKLARELAFVFADIPLSEVPKQDFQRVRLDRGMGHYSDSLAWAQLILDEASPLTGSGGNQAPSLLFPMEALFEAFVAKHLAKQLMAPRVLKTQTRSHHLVGHRGERWFLLKPDLVITDTNRDVMVLDTKWKLVYGLKGNGTEKYGLSQSDFYQLQAYGQSYLDGKGDVVLIYPKSDSFEKSLPVFRFPKTEGLRLWVLPFCLESQLLILPRAEDSCHNHFSNEELVGLLSAFIPQLRAGA